MEQKKYYCADCGRELTEEDLQDCMRGEDTHGNYIYVCEDCADNWVECDDCGCLISPAEQKTCMHGRDTYDDEIFVCGDCEQYYDYCAECGRLIYRDDMVYSEDDEEYFCQDCADELLFYCDHCETYHSIKHNDKHCVYSHGREETWCDSCVDDDAFYCEGCAYWYDRSYYNYYTDRYGNCYCSDCWEENGYGRDYRISCYHDHHDDDLTWYGKIQERWKGYVKDGGKRFHINYGNHRGIGFELEVDDGSDFSSCIDDIEYAVGDRVYFEEDGSLSYEGGFEIISQPHTVEAFWKAKDKWAKMLKYIRQNGFKSHDAGTCGLHVHFSREMFGSTDYKQKLAIAKIINFMEYYKDDIFSISRRREMGQWCNWYGIDTDLTKKAINYCYEIASSRSNGRYYAVNTSNFETIEFRLFRGTLNEKSFFASFDFLINIVNNARNIKWADCHNVEKWLKGMSADTIEYIKSRHAFEDYLGDDNINNEESYIAEVA